MHRLALALALTTTALLSLAPGQAQEPARELTVEPVVFSGTLDRASLSCDGPADDCDTHTVVVDVAPGSWLTVRLDDGQAHHVRVLDEAGRVLGEGGNNVTPGGELRYEQEATSTTWRHERRGTCRPTEAGGDRCRQTLRVKVWESFLLAPLQYRGELRLGGAAFDREPPCLGVVPTVPAALFDDGRVLPLAVRIVADSTEMPAAKADMADLTEIYRRAGVAVTVSYDVVPLPASEDPAVLRDAARRHYGGERPPGVDVVHVATDRFAGGGQAECIGAVPYAEKAFSVGAVNYAAGGAAPVDRVSSGLIAAHEVGHLLGAQHTHAACGAEVVADEALNGDADATRAGACTVMSPLAAAASRSMSIQERRTIREGIVSYLAARTG